MEAHGLATFVGDGDSCGAVSFDGSVQNISASRQLQEALRLEPNKLRNVLENFPFGVDIVNARDEIEYLNTALEKDFGPVAGRRCYQSEKKVYQALRVSEMFLRETRKIARLRRWLANPHTDFFLDGRRL